MNLRPHGPITIDSTVALSPEQIACNVGDESVMLNMQSGVYYGLDPVGTRVWGLLAEPRRVGEIRDALLREYDVDAERCTRELLVLLDDLARAGLINVQRQAGP